jgi:zinc protease
MVLPNSCRILVAGDVSEAEARRVLENAFADWERRNHVGALAVSGATTPEFGFVAAQGLRVYAVDRPAAVQTALHFLAPGVKDADPRRLPLQLVHTILGGSFTSRLNRNLREVHGFTYGAGSSHSAHYILGLTSAQSAVVAESTGPALKEFLGEIERIATGDITEAEVEKARETVKNDITESFGTLRGILSVASEQRVMGKSMADLTADLRATDQLDRATLIKVAKELIKIDGSVLVLVGDRDLITEQTKDLGLPTIEWVLANGEAAPSRPENK